MASRSLGPFRSSNHRLERVFAKAPGYLNRELTLPCEAAPHFVHPLAVGTGLAARIQDHLRVVITPPTYHHLGPEKRAQVRVLAAPLECGRVLELDVKFTAENRDYVLTMKGGGANTFVRERSDDVYARVPMGAIPTNIRTRPELRRFPFIERTGSCTLEAAESERAAANALRHRRIATELVVAIYKILRMPDEMGELQTIPELRRRYWLPDDFDPHLMFRLSRSNLRLFEPFTLRGLGYDAAIPTFLDHVVELYAQEPDAGAHTAAGYDDWLLRRLVPQQLGLALHGYVITKGDWQILSRNTTVCAEEYDTENQVVDSDCFTARETYVSNLHNHLCKLLMVLQRFRSHCGIYTSSRMLNDSVLALVERTVAQELTAGVFDLLPSLTGSTCAGFRRRIVDQLAQWNSLR